MHQHLLFPKDRTFSYQYSADTIIDDRPIAVTVLTTIAQIDQSFSDMTSSLLAQSMRSFEWLLIVENEQEHDVNKVLSDTGALDSLNIQIFYQSCKSSVDAWRQASGNYICFLDSNNVLDPTYIEKCIWYLDANPQLAFCTTLAVLMDGPEDFQATSPQNGLTYIAQMQKDEQTIFMRGSVFRNIISHRKSFCQELEFIDLLLSIASSGKWGAALPEHLRWQYFREADENHTIQIQKLIQEKHRKLLNHFPHSIPANEHKPYATLRLDAPILNTLDSSPQQLKLMFIIPWMVTGGADKFNLDIIEMLAKKGHKITICATLQAEQPWEYKFASLTSDIFVLSRFLKPSDFPRFLSYLIKSRRINTVVISGSMVGYHLLPFLRSHAPKTSFLDLNHVEEPNWLNGGHPRFGVGYQDLLDLNIVSTKHLATWMEARGADASRIRILYTGVHEHHTSDIVTKRNEIRCEFNLPDNLPIIIFGGRICKQKRPVMLANILKELSRMNLPFHAFIIGDGDQRPLFESLLAEYDLASIVHMCGAVSHKRWMNLLQASDVFLLPSEYEGISIALLEAMSVGVVPVVSAVGGQSEIVHKDAGYLIPHSNHECNEYATAIKTLILDTHIRSTMGKRSRLLISKYFSKKATVDTFESIITESRELLISSPRVHIPNRLAIELATSSIELDRLNHAIHTLWDNTHSAKKNIGFMHRIYACLSGLFRK